MSSSLLQDDTPVDSIDASELSTLFTSCSALSTAVTQVCEVRKDSEGQEEDDEAAFEERSSKTRARFIALAKRYWESLPSSSTGGTVTDSTNGLEAAENLVDIIWTVDQAFENGQQTTPATAGDAAQQQQQQQPDKRAVNKLGQLVKEFNSNGILSTELLKQRLETSLLQLAGLLTPSGASIWVRTEARTKTSLLYKQQKYNLLREESEGYSKLEVELLSSMGSPHNNRTAQPSEPLSSVRKRAETTLENIKGLIGYFDLDPARALDVILDVFADNVLYHHVFFRELLQLSPWAPKNRHDPLSTSNGSSGLLPDGGFAPLQDGANTMCAQILGFKFGWYTTPEGSAETPSEKLYLMTAILIWEGLVELPSLWPHLPPTSDEEFSKLKDKYREEISDRIAAARSNALSMAGMLADDLEPPPPPTKAPGTLTIAGSATASAGSAAAAQAAPVTPADPPNIRLGLLRALLSIGAFQQAFWILSTHSWICEPVPEVADLLLRLLNHSISPYYYASVSPFAHKKADVEEKQASLCQARQRYSPSEKKILPGPSSSYAITGRPLEVARTHGAYWREPVYFFSEWQDRLPQCQTAEDILEVVAPLLKIIGVHAGRNREFFVHLLRIAKQETLPSSPRRAPWEGIIRMHLIPALALSEPNPSTTHELWEILRNFPYTSRFAFYGEWKDRLYKRMPELRVKRVETERDAKGLLKRLSSDNVKQFGRSLAKIAHTNPCVLFEIALNQVQSYDNLINPVVESARYLTPFGYDVLAYSLLDALSNPEKERTKSDGTNISLWLQGLATFAGTLCKRWNMEVAYILQYILNQLREGNSKDLVVLRELISKMAGIEPVSDLSDNQIVALGGGPTLQAEALHPTTAIERKGVTKRSTLRLKTALLDAHLVGPLLVAVAKARQECILGLDDAPLKYLGNLFDQCQQVLFQFHDFLLSQLKAEAYGKALPSLRDLWETYGLEAGIAFHVTRPSLQLAIQTYEKVRMERLREELKASRAAKAEAAKIEKVTNGDVTMEGEEAKPQVAVNGALLAEDSDAKPSRAPSPSPAPVAGKGKSPWHPVLEDAIAIATKNMPENMQVYMTPGFFVTFWQLSLYDILIPMERYQNEVDRLNGIVRELDSALRATVPSYPGQLIDKAGEAEKKKARDRCMQTIQELNTELKAHTEAYEATRKRLSTEKAHWFMPDLGQVTSSKDIGNARKLAVQYFCQECLVPRAKLSPIDATFCSRFIRVLHSVGTMNFPSLHVYDRIFSEELSPIVFSCTEGEARNYAGFLHGCLSDLTTWYNNETTYTKQAIGNSLPGFQRVWGTRVANEPIPENAMLTYSQFKTISSKWHKKMCESFAACIESRDYMCIRNTILVLTKIAKFFPMFATQGKQMEEVVASLLATEKREDLRVLALGYSALLKKQSPTWISATSGAQASLASTSSQQSVATSAPSPSPAPVSSAPAASQSSRTASTAPRAPAGNASPARVLPIRPTADSDRERRRAEPVRDPEPSSSTRPTEARRPSELAVPSTNGGRTPHALPARPGLESQRRDSAQSTRQLRSNPSPVSSRTNTPVANRGLDDVQVDEPPRGSRGEDRFARPAAPMSDPKASASRPSSPRRRDAESPRHTPRDPQESPRDERRSVKDEAERPSRRRRAGSEGSSHSSQRDRKESNRSDKDRSDRRERDHRSERSERSDRDRERRSDKDRDRERDRDRDKDKDKDKDSDKSRRDKDRPREKESVRDREPTGRERENRGKESSRDKDSGRERDSNRDKERERRHREPSSRSVDEKKDNKERPRERESRHRDPERRTDPSSSRASETVVSQEKEAAASNKEAPRDKAPPREDSRQFDRTQQPEASTLKRSADSSNSLNELRNGDSRPGDHDQKRRRTDEPLAPPSGPRADRQAPPPPIPNLPSRPSETSIKGRASPREVGTGQGLRIKSAASAASALSSAQQHNARLQRTSGSETPKTPDPQSEPPQISRPTNNDDRPQGLLGRLGAPAPARPREERRESPNDSRDRVNRRPARGR